MQREEIIAATAAFTKETLESAEGGHDWWHIYRVWKSARTIAAEEQVDTLIVELGALLHDIADSKFHKGDESIGPKVARAFLQKLHLDTVELIMEFEKEFNISIPDEQAETITTVGQAVAYLEEHAK